MDGNHVALELFMAQYDLQIIRRILLQLWTDAFLCTALVTLILCHNKFVPGTQLSIS